MTRVLYIGDLHLGNVYCDVLSLAKILRDTVPYVDEVIFVGDFIDSIDKYDTQVYRHIPHTLTVQREAVKWVIEYIKRYNNKAKIVFVRGNHDADFRGVIIDEELFERVYGVKFANVYKDSINFVSIHAINKRSGGSRELAWTPQLLSMAKSILLEHGGDGVVTAHLHKTLSIVRNSRKLFVSLPSFLVNDSNDANDVLFDRVAVVIDERKTIQIVEGLRLQKDEIRRFAIEFYNTVINDRSKATELVESRLPDSGETMEEEEEDEDDTVEVVYGGKRFVFTRREIEFVKRAGVKGYRDIKKLLGCGETRAKALWYLIRQMNG